MEVEGSNRGEYSTCRHHDADEQCGIPQLAFRAISSVDPDARKDLYGSVLLTGGTTLMPGFVDRFHSELTALTPTVCLWMLFVNI